MNICRVAVCGEAAAGYGAYCANDKTRARRHGHPEQEGIRKAELTPYIEKVEARIEKNRANPLWSHVEERWLELLGTAEAVLAVYHSGKPSYRYEVQAAHEIVKLTRAVGSRPIIVAGMAMFILQDQHPKRFKSDEAFTTQLVRRLRGLSDVNAGSWFDHQEGRVKRTYRELPPRTAAVLAGWIVPVTGAAGLKLARLERSEKEKELERLAAFQKALEASE